MVTNEHGILVCQWHRKVGKDAHNQKWLYRTNNLIATNDEINRVLDIKGASTHPGAEVLLKKLETVKGAHPANQRWQLEVLSPDGLPESLSTYDGDQLAGSYAAPVEHVNPWATIDPNADDEPGSAQRSYY